jgi:peroxin-10
MFPLSPQPDIVRSHQKDEFYLSIFKDDLQELLALVLGAQSGFIQNEIEAVAALAYWGLTTGVGSRTLGEEYCDIMQVSGPFRSKLSAWRRLALVVLQVLPQYALANPRRFRIPQSVIDMLQGGVAVGQIQRLHLALFYLYGIYLHISKRVLNVKYVSVSHWGLMLIFVRV